MQEIPVARGFRNGGDVVPGTVRRLLWESALKVAARMNVATGLDPEGSSVAPRMDGRLSIDQIVACVGRVRRVGIARASCGDEIAETILEARGPLHRYVSGCTANARVRRGATADGCAIPRAGCRRVWHGTSPSAPHPLRAAAQSRERA